jgi:hypothetical protein
MEWQISLATAQKVPVVFGLFERKNAYSTNTNPAQ